MVDFRSRNRNYFVLLALMLLLPITGAFATTYSTNFTVNVTDEAGQAIASAGVYIWDINDSPNFYNGYKTQGLTGADGVADLTLSGMVQTTDSTSNPSPNIGILVMPPDETKYAFKTKKILFFNFWEGSPAKPLDVVLEQGCKVNFIPAYDDNPSDTTTDPVSGLVNAMNLAIPNVPATVKSISVNNSNLASGVYSMYWPANAGGNGTLSGDGKIWTETEPQYYSTHYFSFQSGDAGTPVDVPIVHGAKAKGQIDINFTTNGFTVPDTVTRMLHYGYDQTYYYTGNPAIYLPEGNYALNFALKDYPDANGFGPAPAVWPNTIISADSPVVKDYDPGGGAPLTVNIKLGENSEGNESALSYHTQVRVEKFIDAGGYSSFYGYVDSDGTFYTTDGDASVDMGLKLSPGQYRVSLFDEESPYLPGVVDESGSVPTCYGYVSKEIEITDSSPFVLDLVMPQKPAFAATVDATFTGYTYATNNPVRIGYLPQPGEEDSEEITDEVEIATDTNDLTKVNIFVPFAKPREVVVMANLQHSTDTTIAPLFKVFEPYTINLASGTQGPATAYVIDDSNFVNRTGALKLEGDSPTAFAGDATINVDPVITKAGTALRLPASKIFIGDYSLDHHTWKSSDTDFDFAFEQNRPFLLTVAEGDTAYPNSNTYGLNGFVPYREQIATSSPISQDIILKKGGMFTGQLVELTDSGEVNVNTNAQITVTKITEDEWSYNPANTRVGVTATNGSFDVSGLESGEYNVRININGPADPWNMTDDDYTNQTMPIFNQKIFVDATQPPPTEPIKFKFDPAKIGYASGKILDDMGQPIPGVKVGFVPKSEIDDGDKNDYYNEEYFPADAAIFFCVTNAKGELTQNGSTLIPLPSGEYEIWVNGMLNHPASYTYDFGYHYTYSDGSHHYEGRSVRNVNVYAGQITPMSDIFVARRFPLEGVITEDGVPAKYLNFQVLNEMGEPVDWGYTDETGKYHLDSLKPGFMQFGIMINDKTSSRFYLHPVSFQPDPLNPGSIVVDIDLDSTSLNTVTINTFDGNDNPLPWVGGDLKLFADAQNPDAPQWYLTWLDSGENGVIEVKLPDLTMIPQLASSGYVFRPHPKFFEENGEEAQLYPPEAQFLDINSTQAHVVKWIPGSTVEVAPADIAQIPAEKAGNYLGILVRKINFFEPIIPMQDEYAHESYSMPEPSMEDFSHNPFGFLGHDTRGAIFENGKFTFTNVRPGGEYIFVAYEASRAIDEASGDLDTIGDSYYDWSTNRYEIADNGPDLILFYRAMSGPVRVASATVSASAYFAPLADLTVDSLPEPSTIETVQDLEIGFSADRTKTSGKITWPAVFVASQAVDAGFPIKLPASQSYRLSYRPDAESPYLPKTDDDVFVSSKGKTHVMSLRKPNYLSGMVTFGSDIVNGELVLVPVGANVFEPGFEPIGIEVREGRYKAPLAAGEYMGYMVPAQGAPKFVKLAMEKADMTFDIVLEAGVEVSGMVLDTAQMPVPGAAVMVLRKRVATGTIDDGSEFYPYPTFFGDNIVPCGPEGGYRFMAEKNVNYYLQAIAPEGFRPGMPLQVTVGDAAVTAPPLELRTGSKITGILAGPGRIMVRPAFKDGLQDQISSNAEFEVPVYNKDSNEDFRFVIPGLDPDVPYNLTIYPEPGPNGENYAIKRINYVFAGLDGFNLGEITFNLGFKVYGQLLDEEGSPLKMAGVPVNLAMTLPLADSTLVTNNRRLSIRENVAQVVPEDVSLEDVTYEGLWAQTDENGQFVFMGVPSFLSAFIKTEKGFSIDGIDYARARTEDFLNPIDGTGQTYEKNVTIPVGGQIIGRLLDSKGEPVTTGMIEAGFGDMWQEVHPDSNGKFTLSGLVPAASYMVHVRGIPGRVPLFRAGISVEPGQITDLGSLPVIKAIRASGEISNLKYALQHFFTYGVDEKSGLSVIAFDGNYEIKDNALLTRKFMQRIKGENELFWNSTEVASITEMPFELFAGPGKTHLGMVFHTGDETGAQTLISWGWKPGITLPTESQLASAGVDVFDLTQNFGSIESEEAFGTIEGTLKHAIETDYEFFPENAVIALYPVVQNTDGSYTLKQVPFPTAVTNPVGGMWFVEGVPQGDYRIKVISSKYGTQFFKKIVTVGSDPVVEDLVLGASVAKISGKVVDESSNPVANAAIKMVLHEATAMTDTEGSFTFYRPLNEFVIPQLEIRKPGFATTRILEVVTDVATYTDGFDLATDTYIGEFAIEGAAGNAVVKVTDANSGAPMIGAEVTMILEKATNIDSTVEGGDTSFTLFTSAAVQSTDENGVCKFSSVPVGKEVRFRARNFYYKPEVASLTTTGADEIAITLTKAPPKVFYTGRIEPVEGSTTEMTLKSTFDFNQVVEQSRFDMIFAGVNQEVTDTSKFTYPDLMGGRLTNFRFTDTFTKAPSVIATVTYEITSGVATSIGEFDVMAGFRFRREFEVDPLSEDGFAGRMTDENGNQLPTGLSVPPGYLPPEIDTFELKVEDKPEGTPKGDDGEDLVDATFAGPTFEFTFNNSNFGGSTEESQSGLFEVTLEYEEGTKLEPRWQDKDGNWSKVGIIDDTVKWDHPEAGYVTFRVSHLTKFAVLANIADAASSLRCDFDNDGQIEIKDVAYLLAWYQSGYSSDKALVTNVAQELFSGASTTIVNLPSQKIEDLNGDGKANLHDVALLLAWYQTGKSPDANLVRSTAIELLSSLNGSLTNYPGEKINR